MRLDDPDFHYPNGQTVAEMKAWHERWNDEHDYHPELDRLIATVTRLRTGRGEADPLLDADDAYADRMASEQPTCWCPLCGEGLVEL
jgi:hypothetical protein